MKYSHIYKYKNGAKYSSDDNEFDFSKTEK